MCDDRERLLGYVYDDCDAAERRRVDEHLTTCEECREEIAGLRQVRQDLLAWDVPNHESVWKPFAPRKTASLWREVPAWTLAAAASVMLCIGAVGGVATHALTRSAETNSPATEAQIAALRASLMKEVQAEVAARTQVAASNDATPQTVRFEELSQKVSDFINNSQQRHWNDLLGVSNGLSTALRQYKTETDATIASLSSQVELLRAGGLPAGK